MLQQSCRISQGSTHLFYCTAYEITSAITFISLQHLFYFIAHEIRAAVKPYFKLTSKTKTTFSAYVEISVVHMAYVYVFSVCVFGFKRFMVSCGLIQWMNEWMNEWMSIFVLGLWTVSISSRFRSKKFDIVPIVNKRNWPSTSEVITTVTETWRMTDIM